MAKRLQVILKDPEYRDVQKAARARRMSLAQWVREALEAARRRESASETGTKKLQTVRAAARFEFPTGEMDKILAEIEMGYGNRA